MIAQGGVKLDGDAVSELDVPRQRLTGAVLQAGKRRFVRLNGALDAGLDAATLPRLPERAE